MLFNNDHEAEQARVADAAMSCCIEPAHELVAWALDVKVGWNWHHPRKLNINAFRLQPKVEIGKSCE